MFLATITISLLRVRRLVRSYVLSESSAFSFHFLAHIANKVTSSSIESVDILKLREMQMSIILRCSRISL